MLRHDHDGEWIPVESCRGRRCFNQKLDYPAASELQIMDIVSNSDACFQEVEVSVLLRHVLHDKKGKSRPYIACVKLRINLSFTVRTIFSTSILAFTS